VENFQIEQYFIRTLGEKKWEKKMGELKEVCPTVWWGFIPNCQPHACLNQW
jgi:hypothetical protein